MKRILLFIPLFLFFLSADAQIPNPGFETWTDYELFRVQQWKNYGNIRRVASPSGYAARLAYDSASADGAGRTGLLFGYVDFASVNLKGGIPYNERPDSIYISARWNVAMDDSAWIVVNFKQNGTPVKTMNFDIFKIGGNTGGNYVTKGFKINYNPAFPGNADTVLIAITSSGPFENNPASWVDIDEVWFSTGGTRNSALPNGNLDAWTQYNYSEPAGWLSVNTLSSKLSGTTFPVSKSTDTDSGTYAIRLETAIDPVLDTLAGTAYTANRFITGEEPAFPVPARILTLTGWYKYAPVNSDTGLIQVKVYNQGFEVGLGIFQPISTVSTYTPFTVTVSYNSTFTGQPDSASILLASSHPERPRGVGSVLFVDALNWTLNLSVPKTTGQIAAMCYPNPAQDKVKIELMLETPSALNLKVYDLQGRLVLSKDQAKAGAGLQSIETDLSALSPGMYYYVVQSEGGVASGSISKD